MYKKHMLVVNPNAGRSAYKSGLAEAMFLMDKGGYRTTLFFTKGQGDATELIKEHANKYDLVSCVGGDGTLSEVVSGLALLKDPPPLGYFPMGTTNDVANTLGLPKNDNIAAANRILKGQPHDFDIGLFGSSKYFAYIAAFGAFTKVSYETSQDQKKWLGHLAYVLQGAQELTKIEPVWARVEHDNGVIEGNFLYGSMSNSTSVAGIVKLPDNLVSLGDGMSELVLVKNPGNVKDVSEMLETAINRRFDSEYLTILHTRKAKFTFKSPVSWTRDGEEGGAYTEIELSNIPRALKLIF